MIASRPLSLAVQLLTLQKLHPTGCGVVAASREGRRLRWRQEVRPHILGGRYTIEIRYAEGRLPLVLVQQPDLRALAGGRELPHVYAEVDGMTSLCLWWRDDWKQTQPIATTVVPWAAEWFWFFEYWLTTGEWLGGGTHPIEVVPPKPVATPQPTPAIENVA